MAQKYDKSYFYGKKKSNYSNYEKLNHSKRFKNVVSFIKDNKIRGRFLDVGCAFGFLIKEVDPFFDQLYGCDISKYAVEKAKQKNPKAEIKIIDIEEELPYEDESFDCITALDVLEHTKNLKRNFSKIVKKIKNGGYLIVSMPIETWPRKLLGFLDKDKTHISILSEKEILETAVKNQLLLLKKTHYWPAPLFYKIPYVPIEVELYLRKKS